MKIIFFGSSEFSISSLQACIDSKHEVLLVVTTPDRKKGRGLEEFPTPVKIFAQKQELPVESPEDLKYPAILDKARSLHPDLFVVASYGKFIPGSWLKIPSKVCLNVHPSLLPKYRGAAPLHWPILNGDRETGISIAEVTHQLDAGDIFFQKMIPIEAATTSEHLSTELAQIGGQALREVFRRIEEGKLTRTPQEESRSSYARKLAKEDGKIDWSKPADEISRQVRGLLPWPVAFFLFRNEIVQVRRVRMTEETSGPAKPGEIVEIRKQGPMKVQTGKDLLTLEILQPAGKKEMSAAEFAHGRRLQAGDRLNVL